MEWNFKWNTIEHFVTDYGRLKKKSQKDIIYIVPLQSITSYGSFGSFSFVGCNTLPIAANAWVSVSSCVKVIQISSPSCQLSHVKQASAPPMPIAASSYDRWSVSLCARACHDEPTSIPACRAPTARCGAHAQSVAHFSQLQPFCVV